MAKMTAAMSVKPPRGLWREFAFMHHQVGKTGGWRWSNAYQARHGLKLTSPYAASSTGSIEKSGGRTSGLTLSQDQQQLFLFAHCLIDLSKGRDCRQW
jgi:hypothetical protein